MVMRLRHGTIGTRRSSVRVTPTKTGENIQTDLSGIVATSRETIRRVVLLSPTRRLSRLTKERKSHLTPSLSLGLGKKMGSWVLPSISRLSCEAITTAPFLCSTRGPATDQSRHWASISGTYNGTCTDCRACRLIEERRMGDSTP
jgi:hypothetical protein